MNDLALESPALRGIDRTGVESDDRPPAGEFDHPCLLLVTWVSDHEPMTCGGHIGVALSYAGRFDPYVESPQRS
jgi:hypothetical protein